ncbi:MAG: SUMF1/EgtB/PvdO family nonheme iron enzyme, partial [Planctomycetota bacterium]|nr:SUMF1/EgtB/PvdO family nonheme iron enzyme [Planctomycetota bacterium]
AMDYVEGVEFSTITKHQRLPAKQLYDILTPLSSALSLLHKHGIVHRDLKPSNIMINQHGHPLIMDFGIAKQLARNTELTRSGTFVGTLGYMSPEQADNAKAVDHRADIYSLGAILYEALTGRPPHVGASATKILVSLISREPPPPSSLNPSADKILEQICLKALQKEPEQRFRSMDEFNNACLRKTAEVPSIPLAVYGSPLPSNPIPIQPTLSPADRSFNPPAQDFGPLGPPPPGFDPDPLQYSAPQIPPHPLQEMPEDALFDTIDPEPGMAFGASPAATAGEGGNAGKSLLIRSPEDMAASAKRRKLLIAGIVSLILGLGILAFLFSGSEDVKPQGAQVVVELEELNLEDEQWLAKSPIEVRGTLSATPFQLKINDQSVTVTELGFSHLLSFEDGSRGISVVVVENEGDEAKTLKELKIHVDTIAPQIKLEETPESVTKELLRVRGEINDKRVPVYVNGQDSMIDSSRFSALVKLKVGENKIRIEAKDKAGNEQTLVKTVRYKPTIEKVPVVEAKAAGVRFNLKLPVEKTQLTQDETLRIRGRFTPKEATVSVNGRVMKTEDSVLDWTAPLSEGKNEFRIEVQFKDQKKTLKLQVTRDSQAPVLTIDGVKDGQLLSAESLDVSVQSNESLKELLLNEKALKIEGGLRAQLKRALTRDGARTWRFTAIDLAGNKSSKVLKFKIDNTAPKFVYKKPKFIPKTKSLDLKVQIVEAHLVSVTMQKADDAKPKVVALTAEQTFQVNLKSAELRKGVKFCATDKLGQRKTITARSELFYIYDLKAWNSLKKKEIRRYEALEVQRLLGADKFVFQGLSKYYCRRAWSYIATYKHKSGLIFRLIPGGAWTFGFDNNSKAKIMEEAWLNFKRKKKDHVILNTETPQYTALIRPFLLSATEITVKDYYTLGNQKIPKDKRLRHNYPIIRSWTESVAWCKKLGFRLPSEAEWEYACRAGTKTRYFWGQDLDKKAFKYAWLKFNSGPRLRQPRMHMESKCWNAFGLVDMLGNAEEWCQDYWYGNYSKAPMDGRPRPLINNSPTDSKHYKRRAVKGGMYSSSQFSARIARRNHYHYLKNEPVPVTGIRPLFPLPKKSD